MGDLPTAMLIGGTLQLIYFGTISPGGNIPADEAFAACIAIPIAIQTGISAEVAVSLAVPVGLLGVLLDTLRRTYGTVWVRIADKAAEKGDRKASATPHSSASQNENPFYAINPSINLSAHWLQCC